MKSEKDKKDSIKLSAEELKNLKANGYIYLIYVKGLSDRYQIDYDATLRNTNGDENALNICRQLEYELAIISGTGFVDYF